MIYPTPHNPDKLDPIPGYRFLGINETLKTTDEAWWDCTKKEWRITEHPGKTPAAMVSTTYRRALNVDDQYAPPPDQWVQPGWVVDPSPVHPDTYCGKEGDEYWGYRGECWWKMNVGGKLFDLLYIRRPISLINPSPNSSMNTSAPSVKPVLKPGQSIIINTHGNLILSRAVQEAAFAAGWSWVNGSRELDERACKDYPQDATFYFRLDKRLEYSPLGFFKRESAYVNDLFLDARTDLGVLIDLLATPSVKPPKIDGSYGKVYEGKFAKGGDVIEFGCAKIAVNLLECAKAVMDKTQPGNRTVQSITLSSGVSLNREEIKEIIDYVEAVNKG